jgi:hypothetical protein
MAAKLQVRLTFEGGAEMKKALAELGVTGKSSFKGIGSAGEALGATLSAVGAATKKLVEGIAIAGGAVAAVATTIVAVAKSSAEAADAAGKAAQKVGINAQAYQELAFAAKQADVSQESLQAGLKDLNKNLSEARAGNVELAQAFAKLGVPLERTLASSTLRRFAAFAGELGKLPKTATTADFALLKLADAFRKAPDGPDKTAVAMKLLGKNGAELIPLLNSGSKEIASLGRVLVTLGGEFDGNAIKKSEEFNDTLTILETALTGVKNAIGQVFIPELTQFAQAATKFIVDNRGLIIDWVQNGWNFLKQVILDLIEIFKGNDLNVVNTWLLTARDNLKEALDVAKAVGGAIADIARAFGLLNDEKARAQKAQAIADNPLPSRPDGVFPRFASGGRVSGPGTGTSDSILARLSHGEFVMRSAVVDRLGAGFFHALNAGMLPAFASGGMVGGAAVNIHLDGQSFAMQAGQGTVDALVRYGRRKALRAPGRMPSWYSKKS